MRRARIAAGMSQQDAADAVGISANTLRRIEYRNGSPSLAIAAALAVYFKIPAESLLRP